MHDKRAQQTSERNTFYALHHFHIQPLFSPQPNITARSNEARLLLALQALQDDKNLSLRKAAKIYDINHTTLFHRRAGRPARRDILANLRKLTDLEEKTIIQYIIKLYARVFHPRLSYVEDIANQLLRERDAPPVGVQWAHNFIKRQPELRTRFTRKYNYQRAKCEDLIIIREWFALVYNVKVKYSILDDDSYNFNETGFIMGIIIAAMVVTTSDGRSRAK